MKVSELRIGNYVIRQGELIKVTGSDIKWFEDGTYTGIEPIPLTEEWLVKFGFELESTSKWKSGYNDIERIDKVYTTNMFGFESSETIEIDVIYNIEETELRRIGVRKSVGSKTIDIKYVHTLQNLYFTLTGEELQYGEK